MSSILLKMIKECSHKLLNCTLIIACLMSVERKISFSGKLKIEEMRSQELPTSVQ